MKKILLIIIILLIPILIIGCNKDKLKYETIPNEEGLRYELSSTKTVEKLNKEAKIVKVDIKITNEGDKPYYTGPLIPRFTLLDKEKRTYEKMNPTDPNYENYYKDEISFDKPINPGLSIKGSLFFEVPKDIEDFKFVIHDIDKEKIVPLYKITSDEISRAIESQLGPTGEKTTFPRELNLNKGESKVITLGVQNVLNYQLNYKIELLIDCDKTDTSVLNDITNNNPKCINGLLKMPTNSARYDKGCLSLGITDAITHGISIKSPSTSGILALKAKITSYDGDTCTGKESIYAEKLSFITIE